MQRSTIFYNPFLPQEFVEQLCKEYEGTIYYDRLILGLWKRAEGAIYKRFADNPEKFRCEVLEGPADNPEKFRCEVLKDLQTIRNINNSGKMILYR